MSKKSMDSLPFSPEEKVLVLKEYEKLRELYLASNHRKKIEIIDKAFEVANKAHDGVRRISGEPYILHPLAVATIVCKDMGLGSTSICCALLHDVVEDTEYSVEDIRELFTDNIARIVDGVTKVEASEKELKSQQTENYRKLLLTTADDARVILIKLADRLHNMRTLGSMTPAKKSKITGETMFFYAPLAHRLGLFAIKTELEELCFYHESPDKYAMIKEKVEAIQENEHNLLDTFAAPIEAALTSQGIKYKLLKRVKSYYSIWSKMQERNISFEDIFDIFALRIIYSTEDGYPEKNRAWDIYTLIGDIYKAHPKRLREWMSNPKINGYQALHSTYMSQNGRWIEVQIRSERMDAIAEQGVAAHWRYKSDVHDEDMRLRSERMDAIAEQGVAAHWRYKSDVHDEDMRLADWLDSIRTTLEEPTPTAMDFLDNLKLSIYTNTIDVFTPKGKPITLPGGASVLDFAYAIHSSLGDKCIGAKVNHHVVPISTKLQANDQVEILDSNNAKPQPIWLNYVKTIHAKYKIKEALRRQKRELVNKGEEEVIKFFASIGYNVDAKIMDRLAHCIVDAMHEGAQGRGGHKLLESFFEQLGLGHILLPEEVRLHMKHLEDPLSVPALTSFFSMLGAKYWLMEQTPDKEEIPKQSIPKKKNYVLTEAKGVLNYRLARCCHPIPGDDVLGVIDEDVVEVHDKHCARAIRLKSTVGDRLVTTVWGEHKSMRFEIPVIIQGIDSSGVLHAITEILLEENQINISSLHIDSREGVFLGEIKLLVPSLQAFDQIRQKLMSNSSIVNVIRKTADLSKS